jgi:hypothetical protein
VFKVSVERAGVTRTVEWDGALKGDPVLLAHCQMAAEHLLDVPGLFPGMVRVNLGDEYATACLVLYVCREYLGVRPVLTPGREFPHPVEDADSIA